MNASLKPGRLRVGVIGAGRVGAVLGALLNRAGHQVMFASGVSEESRSRIETLLPEATLALPEEIPPQVDLVLLTVPDDALADLVSGMAARGLWQPGQLVIHTSGRYGINVLDPARLAGALPLAIHPAMTFTGTSLDADRLQEAVFAVTAPAPALPIAQALVVELGGEPVVVAEEHRAVYHAALAHGANHVVTVLTQAATTLAQIGIEEPERVLRPLVSASVDGALREAPGSVTLLTGPVVRGDAGTLAAHIQVLAQYPGLVESYRALAQATADLALAGRRISPAQYAEMVTVLALNPE